ncbi:MAG: hypothetical protein EXR11_06230 [Rhodospirillaceae bacterium]|nr:hypothetical protein [Rhodospirillaceae bacterium]
MNIKKIGYGLGLFGALAVSIGSLDFAFAQSRPGAASETPEHITVVYAGTLLAVPGQPAQKDMTLVIKNDRIDRVVSGSPTPSSLGLAESTAVIDLKNRFVLPGLMDAHVHLRSQPSDFPAARAFGAGAPHRFPPIWR